MQMRNHICGLKIASECLTKLFTTTRMLTLLDIEIPGYADGRTFWPGGQLILL